MRCIYQNLSLIRPVDSKKVRSLPKLTKYKLPTLRGDRFFFFFALRRLNEHVAESLREPFQAPVKHLSSTCGDLGRGPPLRLQC